MACEIMRTELDIFPARSEFLKTERFVLMVQVVKVERLSESKYF